MAALKIFQKEKREEQAQSPQTTGGAGAGQLGLHIIKPHVTEKATDFAKGHGYVFVVERRATKKEIAREVGERYGVVVKDVRTSSVPSKRIRLGRIQGVKKGYKKAMVQLQEGQTIEGVPTPSTS